jgi:hypothetical protein
MEVSNDLQKKAEWMAKLGKSITSQWKSVMTEGKKIRVDSQIRQVKSKSIEVSNDLEKKSQSG